MRGVRHFISIFAAILYLSAVGILLPFRYETPVYASGPIKEDLIRKISTPAATLLLGFHGGSVQFEGRLPAAGCAPWEISIASAEETGLEGVVEFDLISEDPGGICIQQLAGEEQVSGSAPARRDTIYVIRLNGEVIFTGPIREEPRLI